MSIKERLLKFLKYKGVSQRMFEREVGLSNGYITNMKQTIMPTKMQLITQHYPELNMGWVMTGDGDMLVDVTSKEKKEEMRRESALGNEPLLAIIREKDRRIEELVRENAELRLMLGQRGIIIPTDTDSIDIRLTK